MGLEGSLDSVREVTEFEETPDIVVPAGEAESEPSQPIVEESDGFHVESLFNNEDLETMLGVEQQKTSAVMNLAESTVDSAIKTTGDSELFANEKSELKAIQQEITMLAKEDFAFADLPELTYETPAVVDGVGVYETNSGVSDTTPITEGLGKLPSYETVETIMPTPQFEQPTETKTEHLSSSVESISRVEARESTTLTEDEATALKRAEAVVYFKSEKATDLNELQGLSEKLSNLSKKEFPDDAKFEEALSVIMADLESRHAGMPVIIKDGAIDVETGKLSNIEILEPGDQNPRHIEAPTKEQVEQANKMLLSTTRGKLIDMQAYLIDYADVASGKIDANMPAERLQDLKRKSWFETPLQNQSTTEKTAQGVVHAERMDSTKSSVENGQKEIISGLALNWADTASYYESVGNLEAANFIRETGKFELNELQSGDIVVGEKHLRLIRDEEHQSRFEAILRGLKPNSLIIVEQNSKSPKNVWSNSSPEERFMDQAEEFAQEPENNVELETLDEEFKTGSEAFDLWKEAGADELISEEEYQVLAGMMDANERVLQPNGLEDLVKEIESNPTMTESGRKAKLLGISRYINHLSRSGPEASEYITQLRSMMSILLEVDSKCREVHYQNIIAKTKLANPDRQVLVVVGDAHREGVAKTLEDPSFRTHVDKSKIALLTQFISKN